MGLPGHEVEGKVWIYISDLILRTKQFFFMNIVTSTLLLLYKPKRKENSLNIMARPQKKIASWLVALGFFYSAVVVRCG